MLFPKGQLPVSCDSTSSSGCGKRWSCVRPSDQPCSMYHEYAIEAATKPGIDAASQSHEQMQAVLAALQSVPDFVRLGNFPEHCSGPVCWCRPHIVVGIQGFAVLHKDLTNGEFDC